MLALAAYAQPEQARGFTDRDQRYRLQPNDVLEVVYRYTPEYNQTVSVQPDGFVSLQIVGDLKVSDLTLDQARSAIFEKASQRLNEPVISLVLKEYEKPHFVVSGEVERPGRFELYGHMTAVEAVAMAGGLKQGRAKHSQAVLFRRTGPDSGETRTLNLRQIMESPHMDEDVELRSGDVLLIPQNRISKIERFVRWSNIGVFWNPVAR